MKKFILPVLFTLSLSVFLNAEAIKLKNGMIINGSITGQTDYILNVKTSYGVITINQREIDKIMPDLHRVVLKGGGEYVGTVLDLDQFNLSLQTDKGVVNIDTSQIASMEIYDYNQAEKQKQYVENKMELEKQAVAATEAKGDSSTLDTKSAAAAAGSSLSKGGLSFDSDLETVFPSKPEVVTAPTYKYNYVTHTDADQPKPAAAANGQQDKNDQASANDTGSKEEVDTEDQINKKDLAKNYFSINAGVLNTPLSLDLSDYGGKKDADIGGANAAFGLTYMRRLSQRFWLGGTLDIGMIPKSKFTDLTVNGEANSTMKMTGQVYDIALISNYYLNPLSKTRYYLTGGAGYTSVSAEGNPSNDAENDMDSISFSSSGVSALFGAGIERTIQDINVGLEVRGKYSSYGGKLKDSSNIGFLAGLKVNWFF